MIVSCEMFNVIRVFVICMKKNKQQNRDGGKVIVPFAMAIMAKKWYSSVLLQ